MQIMKKFIISFLGIGLACILIHACSKKTISGDSSNLIEGAYITLDSTISSSMNISVPTASVSIAIKGSVGSPIASINIYAATGSSSTDTSTWVLIKNVPYSPGVVLTVTTAELAAAFAPTPLEGGNNYVLQNQVVTKDGRKFSAANTPTNYSSFPAYHMALTWYATALCTFVSTDAAGLYSVVTDTWVDYNKGDKINVSAGPGVDEINLLMYPSTIIGGGTGQVNVVIDVDPNTDIATIKPQFTGYYGAASPANLVTLSGTGIVFSCTGYIKMHMTINVGGTDYTGYLFQIQK
jgi:hypothetical protein